MVPEPLRPLLCAALLIAAGACGNDIGDDCKSALDCSSQGSRLCDRTQPHGYCTLRGCESGTCPEDSVCVKFRPEQERLATTYCMAKCEDDDDCRSDEGYECTGPEDFGDGTGAVEAEILGRPDDQHFCSAAVVPSVQTVVPPAQEDVPRDGGPGDGGPGDGGADAAASAP